MKTHHLRKLGTKKCLKATMAPSNKDSAGSFIHPDVDGTVTVCFPTSTSNWGTLSMDVSGLRPNVKAGITSGGVHVHTGTSCGSEVQGRHYFKSRTNGIKNDGDPWYWQKTSIAPTGTGYTTCPLGNAKYQEFTFNQGYGYSSTLGKVIVIHDANTTAAGYKRVACGKLVAAELL